MGVQPATLDPGLVRAEPSADAEPPTCNVASVSVDVKMGTLTVSGSAQDTGVCSSFFYFFSALVTYCLQKHKAAAGSLRLRSLDHGISNEK
jgi:hypothetical protein